MAANLLGAGYALAVYSRTPSKAEPLAARGARMAACPADVVTRGGVVVTALWDDAALEEVVTSDGFLERLGPGGIHVSTGTVLPETARRLAAAHAERGSDYVEAPIFGRPEAAVARKLWIPIAGSKAAKRQARPVLEAMGGQGIFDFGEAIGAATTVKLAGNFLMVSAGRSMIEAFALAAKSGVDVKAVVDMLSDTLFSAPMYQAYGKMIAGKAPMAPAGAGLKDIDLFLRTAEQVDAGAPIASRLHEILKGAGAAEGAPLR
jgi:3-hydroxyisobutyrate dehydrogenase-like beta-hydroxyacid dehydrogenase